jgi:hypothetical protein
MFLTTVFLPAILFVTCSTHRVNESGMATSFPDGKRSSAENIEYQTAGIENSNSNTLWPVAKFSTETEEEYGEMNETP